MVPVTLRELRLRNGWTLTLLARRSGLDKAVVSQIERGRLQPTADELDKLASAIGVPLVMRTLPVHEHQA